MGLTDVYKLKIVDSGKCSFIPDFDCHYQENNVL